MRGKRELCRYSSVAPDSDCVAKAVVVLLCILENAVPVLSESVLKHTSRAFSEVRDEPMR